MRRRSHVAAVQYRRLCTRHMDGSWTKSTVKTSGYATSFTAGGAIRVAHYDVIDDVITPKL